MPELPRVVLPLTGPQRQATGLVAALVAEAVILVLFALQSYEVIRPIGFLWFNLIAPAIVLLGASGLQALLPGAGIERTIDRSE